MSPSQRKTYFARLWPDACKAQGWNPKDEERRRDVTHAATGQESTSKLSQKQITLLFNKLAWLADPNNFEKAFADANPEIALADHQRGQVIWRIEKAANEKGFNSVYLDKAAEHKCRVHNARSWSELPIQELINFSKTISARQGNKKPVKEACAGVVAEDSLPF